MEIRTYTNKNIERLFLSMYTEVIRQSENIIFRNSLFNKCMILQIPYEYQVDFLRKLDKGCSLEDMEEMLKKAYISLSDDKTEKEDAQELNRKCIQIIFQMMRQGILE